MFVTTLTFCQNTIRYLLTFSSSVLDLLKFCTQSVPPTFVNFWVPCVYVPLHFHSQGGAIVNLAPMVIINRGGYAVQGCKTKFFQNQKFFLFFGFFFGFFLVSLFVFFLFFWFITLKKKKIICIYILYCSAFINTKLLSQSPKIIK